MKDLSYVRKEMLPSQTPPATSSGVIGWVREKLFRSPLDAVLTLCGLAFIYALLSIVVPWAISPTWHATSLNQCREILHEMGREGRYAGACWGVIRERWVQLLFWSYPPALYWRPILAFILLVGALAPVLFSEHTPKKLIWLTFLYPFIMVWLLWGGSVWTPFTALVGVVIALLASRAGSKTSSILLSLVAPAAATLLWYVFLAGPLAEVLHRYIPLGIEAVPSRNFGGFMLSFTIGLTSIGLSLPAGILLGLGRQSNLRVIKALSIGFIEFIRGVPLITLLFVASTLLNIFLPPGTNFDIILRVIIMAAIFEAAYIAEVIRGGLAALPTGQYEGASSLGLGYWQSQRLVIMPQALKISIPGIVSSFIGLFKDTTLVSIIGLLDPLGLSNSIRADANWNGIIWELYGFIALGFFIVCFGMSRYSMYLERKLHAGRR
nr:amino acid ABC transporter permease [uncultured Shinella sp.]